MGMTARQTLLAACRGEQLDRLPFGPRIDLWYNYHKSHGTLPPEYQGWTMMDICRDVGVAAQYRYSSLVLEEVVDVEIVETERMPYKTTVYRTPHGTVSKSLMFNPHEGAMVAYESEHLFKNAADYAAINYILEHTTPVLDPGYIEACKEVGDDGLVMSGIRVSPAQRVMREIMGYETFFYELMDHPGKVEELIGAAAALDRKKLELVLATDIELVQLCGNWTDDIHTPVFRRFFVPWFQEVNELLHAHGKLSMAHTDGENRRLLPLLRDTDIDVFEAFAPAPMTKVTNAEFRRAVGDDRTVWGGIPSTLFSESTSDEEFDNYIINNLFREIAPGYRFIVGMGDNLPFDAKLERVVRVSEMIDKQGGLPLSL